MFPIPAQGNLIKSRVQNVPNHSTPAWEGSTACAILRGTASPALGKHVGPWRVGVTHTFSSSSHNNRGSRACSQATVLHTNPAHLLIPLSLYAFLQAAFLLQDQNHFIRYLLQLSGERSEHEAPGACFVPSPAPSAILQCVALSKRGMNVPPRAEVHTQLPNPSKLDTQG